MRACLTLLATFWLLSSSMAGADDGSVQRDGFKLYYRTSGSGAPAVLLSGGPGFDVDYMTPVAEHLPASFQRVFLEQRATGRSRLPKLTRENMTVRLAVEDVEALRVALGKERLVLVGHSWGGMLAMAYAAAHPVHVDRMVLIDSGGPTMEFTQWFGDNIEARLRPEDLEKRRYWQDARKRGGFDADKIAFEGIRAIVPGYFFDRSKALDYAAHMPEGSFHAGVGPLMSADLVKNYDLRRSFDNFTRPVLIVEGRQDPIGDLTAEQIHGLIKTSTVKYLTQCGHFPWVEKPEEFYRLVNEFLEAK